MSILPLKFARRVRIFNAFDGFRVPILFRVPTALNLVPSFIVPHFYLLVIIRKFAGSILDCVIGIFHWYNPCGRTMALGSTQLLTEMSTRNIYWRVKAAGE